MIDRLLAGFQYACADHPLFLYIGLLLVMSAYPARAALSGTPRESVASCRALTVGSGLVVAAYGALVIWYTLMPAYADHVEPVISIIAWRFTQGLPVYHGLLDPARYAQVYGPLIFIVHGWWLWLLGPSTLTSKLLGACAALSSVPILFVTLRRLAAPRTALIGTAAAVLFYLAFGFISFWNRPDSILLWLVCVQLLASAYWPRAAAIVITALCAGAAVDLKITAVFYSLPALALLYLRFGLLDVSAAVAGAAVSSLLPFALPAISLRHYMAWLGVPVQNGVRLQILRLNIEWALFLLLPFAWRRAAGDRAAREWVFPAALCLGLFGPAIIGATPGAGVHHLLPLVPVAIYGAVRHGVTLDALTRDAARRWRVYAYLAAIAAVALCRQADILRAFSPNRNLDPTAEIREVLRTSPRPIAMGYGDDDDYDLTFYRTALVFAGQPYPLDAPSIMDAQLAGIHLPPATIEEIRRCEFKTWLVPRGSAPFTMRNYYPAHRPLFDAGFREAFAQHYRVTGQTPHYDLFTCR